MQEQNNIHKLIENIETVIKGKRDQIVNVVTCLIAGGHILMEDNPGTGKTVLAKTLAGSIGGNAVFKRIQFTPDLLPMDLLGTFILDDKRTDFVFKKGPLFCNILLADEINRASPKVQSALLEAMAENQITMGDQTFTLESVFFTIATQNPVEMEGTYPLPAAQLDRFYMKIIFGYVNESSELNIYNNYLNIDHNLNSIQAVLNMDELILIKQKANEVSVHEEIVKSVSNIVRATRENAGISLGASPRAGIALLKCIRAHALIHGRSFATEQDIARLTHFVLDHRLIYRNKEAQRSALQQIVQAEITRLTQLRLF